MHLLSALLTGVCKDDVWDIFTNITSFKSLNSFWGQVDGLALKGEGLGALAWDPKLCSSTLIRQLTTKNRTNWGASALSLPVWTGLIVAVKMGRQGLGGGWLSSQST